MTETNYAVGPGEYLAEWMDENHRDSFLEIAEELDITIPTLRLFIIGKLRINEVDALHLQELTSIPAGTWMNYEMQYNKDLVRLYEN